MEQEDVERNMLDEVRSSCIENYEPPQARNAWTLYKVKKDQPNMPLLTFKASVATSLIILGLTRTKRLGRPSTALAENSKKKRTAPPKVPLEVRYDGTDHYPIKVKTSQAPRCHDRRCKSRTRYMCGKCNQYALNVW